MNSKEFCDYPVIPSGPRSIGAYCVRPAGHAGHHSVQCNEDDERRAAVATPLKGDAVVLVNEPFVLDPQAARETVEALKARDATMYRRADLRSRIVLAMSGMDEQQLGVLCEHAERLVVASCGPISSPDDGGIVEACNPPCGLGYTCIVDSCEKTGAPWWPAQPEALDVDAGAGR